MAYQRGEIDKARICWTNRPFMTTFLVRFIDGREMVVGFTANESDREARHAVSKSSDRSVVVELEEQVPLFAIKRLVPLFALKKEPLAEGLIGQN